MNVTVFGAAGWAGRAILANLKGRHQVRAVDHGPGAWDNLRDDRRRLGWRDRSRRHLRLRGRPRRRRGLGRHRPHGRVQLPHRGRLPRRPVVPGQPEGPVQRAGGVAAAGRGPRRPHRLLPRGAPAGRVLRQRGAPARRQPVRRPQTAAGGDVPADARGLRPAHRRAAAVLHRRQPPGDREVAQRPARRLEHRLGLPPRPGRGLPSRRRAGGAGVRGPAHGRRRGGGRLLQPPPAAWRCWAWSTGGTWTSTAEGGVPPGTAFARFVPGAQQMPPGSFSLPGRSRVARCADEGSARRQQMSAGSFFSSVEVLALRAAPPESRLGAIEAPEVGGAPGSCFRLEQPDLGSDSPGARPGADRIPPAILPSI